LNDFKEHDSKLPLLVFAEQAHRLKRRRAAVVSPSGERM
jgi:hypothetical protein